MNSKRNNFVIVVFILFNLIVKGDNSKPPNLYDNEMTKKFSNSENKDVLTINFMNIARMGDGGKEFWDIRDPGITETSRYINNQLADFDGKIYNEWIITDFLSSAVIRKIYLSNNIDPEITKDIKVKGFHYYWGELANFFTAISPHHGKRDENIITCLQYELAYNENGKKYYALTNNAKCIDNAKSRWYFKPNDKDFNIISSYDNKCLVYLDNKYLSTYPCDKDSKEIKINKLFNLSNNKICSSTNNKLCTDNDYNIS